MNILLTVVLIVLGILVFGVLFLRARTRRGGEKVYLEAVRILEPILLDLEGKKEPDQDRIREGATNSQTRNALWDMLMFHKRLDLFPKEFLSWQSLAESAMVSWLCHPSELGSPPDEIELMGEVPSPDHVHRTPRFYFVFRFRTHPPHWAADQGWLAGITGPHNLQAEPMPGGDHTFSRFEPYDKYTPEEHVARVCELLAKVKK